MSKRRKPPPRWHKGDRRILRPTPAHSAPPAVGSMSRRRSARFQRRNGYARGHQQMATAVLIVVIFTGLGLLASVVMSRAADHSALWNMGFAVVLLVGLIVLLYVLAWLITWMAVS